MTESAKTLAFVGAAALSVAVAVATRPSSGTFDVSDLIGTKLTDDFKPGEAKRLKIVDVDEASATMETFEVAEQEGLWTLPSKGGYPADAEEQLAKAVSEVTGREILLIASEDPGDHEQFGVIDPTSPKLEPGQPGVGQLVSLAKEDGKPLADLIIGKEVKDQEDQRYVRRVGQDATFVVAVDPDNFSTDFADWIEDDLLKLSPWDILRVRVRDYSAELFMTLQGIGVETEYRTDMTFGYDDGESKWNLETFEQATDPRRGDFQPAELPADQELDEDKLRDLKNALDDLKIVDVTTKPEGLSANLKAGEDLVKNQEDMLGLVQRGFAPTRNQAGELEILSSEGEVICTMKDGVEYVLRFGNLKLAGSDDKPEGEPADNADAEGDAEEDSEDAGVNRYLFVMARFNEGVIEKPELEEVPALPDDAENAPSSEGPAETDSGDDEGGDGAAPEETGDAETDAKADNDQQGEPSELEKAVTARKEVEQRNARLLDEYEDKLVDGRERVKELNARFGDWYYVIADDVYQKIHLSRDDVTKTKEADEEEGGDESGDGGNDPNASAFGAPGAAVPGLPGLGQALADTEEDAEESEAPAEEPVAEPAEAAQPDEPETSTSEEAAETPAESADAEPAAEEAAVEGLEEAAQP